jgi:hypothetical protein
MSSEQQPTKVLGSLSRSEARGLPAGAVVELGSGLLTDDARPVLETRRVTVLRFGRAIVKYGEYLPAASEPVPLKSDETVRCPACSEPVLASARKCKHCGEWITPAVSITAQPRPASSSLRTFGIVTSVIAGVLIILALAMDTSVSTPAGQRVHNIGLLNQQQNFLMLGAVLAVVGVILIVSGRRK